MAGRKRAFLALAASFGSLLLLAALGVLRQALNRPEWEDRAGTYAPLAPDTSEEDPLACLNEDFTVTEAFSSHLPIVILHLDGEPGEYKSFSDSTEQVDESVEPYTEGSIRILDAAGGRAALTDRPVYTGRLRLKKRGHTSFSYDKPQYLMKMIGADGLENRTAILGMGEGDEWILNGSMADKSMLRNYLPYRIASEIGGNAFAPDSRYCELLLEREDGALEYRGVYLLMESVARGESRIPLKGYRENEPYTSYIVRRDRYTNFDVMLDTYGRENGLAEQWIGVKYPAAARLTPQAKAYIEQDFSRTERILYAEDEAVFKAYDQYLDVDSFVDYFLVNEYFGNYDAGEHSTYLYKDSGGLLSVGPVWDFDQAMNNYFAEEMDASVLAFQTKPMFAQLARDRRFIRLLKSRYSVLRRGALSEAHVFAVMEEASAYLRSAREREWYRWAADYTDGSFQNPHNYYLQGYVSGGLWIDRFNDDYEQELYTIRTYLHRHGNAMQRELTGLLGMADFDTSIGNENELFLLAVMLLFLTPSVLIGRRG